MEKEFTPEEKTLLTEIGNNVSIDSLRILAAKSRIKGIDQKLKMYQHMIK